MIPSVVVTNAQIQTGNPERPWATGLAIVEKKLAVIGSSAEIQKLVHPTTRIIDAGGRIVPIPDGAGVGSLVRVVIHEDGTVAIVDSVEENSI